MPTKIENIIEKLQPDERYIIQKQLDKLISTEAELEESYQRYRTLIENAPEAIVLLDVDKNIYVDVNQNAVELYKLPREELLKVGPISLSPHQQPGGRKSAESAKEKIMEAVEGKTPIFEWIHLDSMGNEIPCEVRLVRFPSATNTLVRGSIIDISERLQDVHKNKQVEIALRESEKKYRELFEKSADAILIIENGMFVDCNQATVEMLGYKNKEELLQTHPSELSPESQPDGRASIEKADEMMRIAIEKGSNRFEWAHVKANGVVFSVEVLLTPVVIDKEKLILHTVWRDITESKRAREIEYVLYQISEAVHKRETLRGMLKVVHKQLGKLLDTTNFYVALYNDLEDTYSFPFYKDEIDEVDESEIQILKDGLTDYVRRTGKPLYCNIEKSRLLEKEGELKIIGTNPEIWLGAPLIVSEKVIGVVAVQDYHDSQKYTKRDLDLLNFVSENISSAIDKKMADEALSQSEKELKNLINDKDKLFSIIAHDLRAPFNALLGYTEFLSKEVKSLDRDEIEKVAENMNRSAFSVFRLLENLLQWSRYQTGRINYSPRQYYLNDQIEEVIGIFSINSLKKDIKIETRVDQNTMVFADKDMIETVLRNLISNALKFTERGGLIYLTSIENGKNLEISVVDNGIGIHQDILEKLFDVGETHTKLGTENEKGTGLGLLLCKDFVKKNRGRISVETELGKGSRFYFTLPVKNL